MAASASQGPADLILRNGAIHTLDPARPRAEAIAIRGGRLVAVGSDAEVLQHKGSGTRVADLKGRMVMPGILDVHNHQMMAGRGALYEMTFPPVLSFEQILDLVRARAKAAKSADEWIVGGIWPSDILDRITSLDAKRALDEAGQGHPVLLRDDTQHNRWVNSRALELAGIDARTPDPKDGIIVRDGAGGEPVGLLFETACALVERVAAIAGPYTAENDVAATEAAVKILNSYGVTGFQDAAAARPVLAALKELDDRGGLSAWAVASMPAIEVPFLSGQAGEALFAEREKYRSAHVRPDFVKVFLDGVPTARTAAFLEPYRPDAVYGCCFRGGTKMTLPELSRLIARAEELNLGVKIHCAGDAAVRQTLDAIDVVRSFNGPTKLRHHIAHASYIDEADIPRFAALGVVADLSPIIWFPNAIVEAMRQTLTEERALRFWPNRDLIAAGALLAAGSDWPVVAEPDPWLGMEGLITRRNPKGEVAGALWPEQAIDLQTAIGIYTINSARAMGLDQVTGSLEVGKSADFIVLERSLFEIAPDEIADTRVLATYFAGEPVFERG